MANMLDTQETAADRDCRRFHELDETAQEIAELVLDRVTDPDLANFILRRAAMAVTDRTPNGTRYGRNRRRGRTAQHQKKEAVTCISATNG